MEGEGERRTYGYQTYRTMYYSTKAHYLLQMKYIGLYKAWETGLNDFWCTYVGGKIFVTSAYTVMYQTVGALKLP